MFLVAAVPVLPVVGVTRAQIDEARADSKEGYDAYKAARAQFDEHAVALERSTPIWNTPNMRNV